MMKLDKVETLNTLWLTHGVSKTTMYKI